MKLKNCKLGEVVTDGNRIGHIVGFTTKYTLEEYKVRTTPENVIPLVHFGGMFEPIGINQCNIEIYKGNL